MITRYSRLRMRRKIRARKKTITQKADAANKEIERHIFRRFHNWQNARRFLISWGILTVLLVAGLILQLRSLNSTYLYTSPISGGVYSEGVVGNVKNVNPIYAVSSADTTLSTLLFNGLLTYDANNQLTSDIAKSWQADATAKKYTVTLRDDVYWHDGEKVTADDVVFTYKTIQNPDANSPLYNTWRGIKVEKQDDYTVVFSLPNAYSPFLHLLTTGIIPEHILASIEKDQLRANKFNSQSPVGTGPFKWRDIIVQSSGGNVSSETVQLDKNTTFHKGEVQLDGYTLVTYQDQKELLTALSDKQVIGAIVEDGAGEEVIHTTHFNQTSATMLFLNTKQPLTKDLKLRQALIKSLNPGEVSATLGYPTIAVRSPILKDEIGYNAQVLQLPPSPDEANALLDELGWTWAEGEPYRKKDGKELILQFVSENTPAYAKLSEEIQRQWAQFGIKVNVTLESPEDLSAESLSTKDYDVLLYAVNIGADPDVYVYWHSSQAKPDARPGFNFSQYESAKADRSLEDGRSRIDPALRAIKYQPFLEAWKSDTPAIGLHQPRLSYATNIPVYNLQEMTINVASDRFRNVHNWQIITEKRTTE